ncbi:MAG: Wzt carbohydrate-binding domain-containing protein [Ruthenibacterium sp.]
MELNPELTEYGSRQAEIIDYAVLDESNSITNVLEKSTTCTLQMKVRFHETIRHPIFAIMIKDRKGNELTGTNTMVEKCDTGTPQAGTVMTVQFTQKMDLQGGFYLLSLGCTNFEKGELVVYHRLYDVCSIQVIAVKNSVGIYDMNSEIHVQTIESK